MVGVRDDDGGGVDNLLHELYYNTQHPTAYTNARNIYREALKTFPDVTRGHVERWFQKQLTPSLHKPVRINFKRNKTVVMSMHEQWQADLCDMSLKKSDNDGYTFLLTCIDCFSKYAWVVPIKNKSGGEIVRALESILISSGRSPKRLQTDKGSEFRNARVQQLLKSNNIHFFTTNSVKKASIVERFNRTLKGRIYKFFTAQNTYRYIDALQQIVDGYNNTHHRSIKMKPAMVRKEHEFAIRQRLYGSRASTRRSKKYKYSIGDLVRITKERLTFARGYLPTWSEEIFIVFDRSATQQEFIYTLKDFQGERIEGGFYEKELQRAREPDEYRIERVLRRKRVNGKLLHLVKWKGWSEKFNSWVENPHRL